MMNVEYDGARENEKEAEKDAGGEKADKEIWPGITAGRVR
jgi:hypothetical protein